MLINDLITVDVGRWAVELWISIHVCTLCFLSLLIHDNNRFVLKVSWPTPQSNQEPAGNISYLNASWVELAGINSK